MGKFTIFKYIFAFLITVGIISGLILKSKYPEALANIFKPVSVVSNAIVDGHLKTTDGRTNILILGMDKRSTENHNVSSVLTDTMMVVSIDEKGEKPVVISIPRDLWVPETQSKINAVYALSGKDINLTKKAVEVVVGMPIHYYVLVGFDAFKDSVDAVGGINIVVDETFDDYLYPIEGMENAIPESLRYEYLHFDAGSQTMDGETTLKYARSRHSTNANEQGDFARARRQQKVAVAIKDKATSADTLLNPTKIKDLYDSYSKNIVTDITLSDALVFYQKYKDLEIGGISKIVLSNETRNEDNLGSGTLIAPTEEERAEMYTGQYVLIPADRTYNHIHGMIRSALFE